MWLAQGVGDVKNFLSLLKQRLRDNFIQSWTDRLNNSSRALFYRQIVVFYYQSYLNAINITKYKSAFTRLRVYSHRLQVEVGRLHNKPFNERKCQICHKLEDEYHLVFECILFTDLRTKYLKPYYCRHPNMFKAIQLFQTTNINILRDLATFFYRANERKISSL